MIDLNDPKEFAALPEWGARAAELAALVDAKQLEEAAAFLNALDADDLRRLAIAATAAAQMFLVAAAGGESPATYLIREAKALGTLS